MKTKKLIGGASFLPLLVALMACQPYVAQDEDLRSKLQSYEAQIQEYELIKAEYELIKNQNALIKTHNDAYEQLSEELKKALDDLRGDGVTRTASGAWVFEVDLLFQPGSAKISTNGSKALERFIGIWKGKDVKFKIVGHTDKDPIKRTAAVYKTGTNLELGMHRALRVMEFMLKQGVPELRISLESKGANEPVSLGESAEVKRKNRRVEIYVHAGAKR